MDGFDVACVGGATADLFLLVDPNNPHFKFNEETNEITINLGEKLVIDNAKFTIGGNACNVSVGLKRLGLNSSLIAEIGDDEFADKILKGLEKEGVDLSFAKRSSGQTSFSTIINYKDDRVIFTEKLEKEHDFNLKNLSTKWVYLTSLGNKWEGAYQRVFNYVRDNYLKLAFNPGGTQIDTGLASFSYILPQTEVLILNKEEAVRIANGKLQIANSEIDIKNLLFELKNLGPRIVVITDGKNGSHAVDRERKVYFQKAMDVPVVSKTGAGDAYSSGFLGAVLSGKKIREAMNWGTKNAASVLGQVGSQAGLMSKNELL